MTPDTCEITNNDGAYKDCVLFQTGDDFTNWQVTHDYEAKAWRGHLAVSADLYSPFEHVRPLTPDELAVAINMIATL